MKFAAVIALSVAALVAAAGASGRAPAGSPPINFGVADDASKYADDGGAWFDQQLLGANLTENRWTLAWDPSNPTTIRELPFLERAAPVAQANGVHVVLALYSLKASQHDPAGFCGWAATVATTVAAWGIHDYIVGNEPNTRLYWVPQKVGHRDQAARDYEALLASCYDAIHAADPVANVIGMGLSPRASTSQSTEPLTFLRDVGAAYRASPRSNPVTGLPLMDQLAVHPYPNPNSPADAPSVGYPSSLRFGIPNLDRVKQAVYDAFNGTAQKTTVDGLSFRVDEVAWQVSTDPASSGSGLSAGDVQAMGYINQENVRTVSQQTQAAYLRQMISRYFACDPTVTDVELFLLQDETSRDGRDANGTVVGGGWQSGLLTAGAPDVAKQRLAYATVGQLAAEGRDACTAVPLAWSPVGKHRRRS